MKIFLALCICAACFLPVTAFAATLTDDFASLESTAWRSYHNLNASPPNIAAELGWPSAPDGTALSLTSPLATASALYAVEGAQSVQVALYSNFSTVAAKRDGRYCLGSFYDSDVSSRTRVRLGADGSSLYLHAGGSWLEARRQPDASFLFSPCSAPGRAAENYGLTVLCSPDNRSFSELSASLSGIVNAQENDGDSVYFYETYSVSLPAGTRFVRLELREARAFVLEEGGLQTNSARGSLRFARAQFSGGSAAWGSLAEEPPTPVPPSSSGEGGSSSGGSSSDPDLQPPPPPRESDEDENSKPKKKRASSSEEASEEAPSSKASSRSSRAAVKGAVTSADAAVSSSDEFAPPEDADPLPPEPERAAVAPWSGTESGGRKAFAGVYMVGAVAVLALFLRKK